MPPRPYQACEATSILCAADIGAAISHFTEILGWQLAWDWGDPVDFACVTLDQVELFLCHDGQGQPGTWLMVFLTGDIDAYHADLVKRGATIHRPPTDMPWGVREMIVEITDGHHIRFGVSLPHDDAGPAEPCAEPDSG